MWVQGEAIGVHTAAAQFLHRLLGVLTQVLRIAFVYVSSFAVAHQQDQFLLLGLTQRETFVV